MTDGMAPSAASDLFLVSRWSMSLMANLPTDGSR